MSQVYGFRKYPDRAQIYKHPFSGVVLATPVLDLSSVRGPQGYADRSGTGANGVPAGAPCNMRGVFDEGVRFGGVRDYLNCGGNAPLDIAGAMSAGAWLKTSVAIGHLMSKCNGVLGWVLGIGATILYYTSGTPGWVAGTSTITDGNWHYLFITNNGTIARLFVDGLQEYRGSLASADSPASDLLVGAGVGGTTAFVVGPTELPQEWNGALSPEQVYRNYLQAKDVPIYYDTFESYAVTPVAKAVGAMCGPFRVTINSLSITVDANGKKWITAGGAVAASGVAKWPEIAGYGTWEFDVTKAGAATGIVLGVVMSANAAWVDASQNGYIFIIDDIERFVIYRVTGGAPVFAVCITAAGYVALATAYKVRIVRRVGGQWALYAKGGALIDWTLIATPYVDNTYTSGGFFNMSVGAATDMIGNISYVRVCERPASFPWEFSSGTYAGLVSGSSIWNRCITSGLVYIPKDLDWQTCILGAYHGVVVANQDILFACTEIGNAALATQNGYMLRLIGNTGVISLCRVDGGAVTVIQSTAAGFFANTTEYEIKITHNGTTNAYDFFIRGGAYATWTSMGLAAVLGIYTSGNYWCHDLGTGDRTSAPQFYSDLR